MWLEDGLVWESAGVCGGVRESLGEYEGVQESKGVCMRVRKAASQY